MMDFYIHNIENVLITFLEANLTAVPVVPHTGRLTPINVTTAPNSDKRWVGFSLVCPRIINQRSGHP
jgi:hypothetical protein